MKFLILFMVMFVFRIMASEDLVEAHPFRPFLDTIAVCDKNVASFLDGQSLIALSKTNQYWRTLLLDQKVWQYEAKSLLGIPLSRGVARDYVLNNYNYTFQDVDAADGYTRVRLSDDGLTAVLTRWNVQSGVNPCTKIINRNGTIVILDGCIANVVSREGSVIAGWCAIHGTDDCRAFRWTKAGLELLPEAATRSIALRIEMDTGYRVIIVGTIEGPLVQGTIFHWQDDQVTVSYGHNVNVDTNIDTVSSDGLIFKSLYKKWYSWHLSPMRCDLDRNEEFMDDILKRAKVLDEGWILETVDSVSSNGVFMAGFGAKNGQRRVFVATVPRSHIAVASNSSFFQKMQNVAVDYAFRAFSGILFKYTKYFPLPI